MKRLKDSDIQEIQGKLESCEIRKEIETFRRKHGTLTEEELRITFTI